MINSSILLYIVAARAYHNFSSQTALSSHLSSVGSAEGFQSMGEFLPRLCNSLIWIIDKSLCDIYHSFFTNGLNSQIWKVASHMVRMLCGESTG